MKKSIIILMFIFLFAGVPVFSVQAQTATTSKKTAASLTKENAALKLKVKQLEKLVAELEVSKCEPNDHKQNSSTSTELSAFSIVKDYITKRNQIMNKTYAIMKEVGNTQVYSYSGVLSNSMKKIESLAYEINSLTIPNISYSEYLLKDKTIMKDFNKNYYSYLLAKKSYEDSKGNPSLRSLFIEDISKYGEKYDENLQQLGNNFEYVIFEYEKTIKN